MKIELRNRGHRTEAWGYAGEELIHIFGFATKIGNHAAGYPRDRLPRFLDLVRRHQG